MFIKRIAKDLRISPEVIKTDKFGSRYNLSAQEWIDTYSYLLANGEMDFMRKYFNN